MSTHKIVPDIILIDTQEIISYTLYRSFIECGYTESEFDCGGASSTADCNVCIFDNDVQGCILGTLESTDLIDNIITEEKLNKMGL